MPGLIEPERTVTWLSDEIVTISVKSLFSGQVHTMTLPLTKAQWEDWRAGNYIQRAMPHLLPHEREFIMTGATEDEWNQEFKDPT